MLSQILVADEMLAANEVDGVENDDKLIKKYGKSSKTGKLHKSQKSSKTTKSKSVKKFKF